MEETNRWDCESEDGERFVVLEMTFFSQIKTLQGPGRRVRGSRSYQLPDGSSVNRLADGEFKIVESGTILRAVS